MKQRIINIALHSNYPIYHSNDNAIFSPLKYITFDLDCLIDDYNYFYKKIEVIKDEIQVNDLFTICDWLYEWYKIIDHTILGERISNAIRYIISIINSHRRWTLCP